jgi:hypothetical protein
MSMDSYGVTYVQSYITEETADTQLVEAVTSHRFDIDHVSLNIAALTSGYVRIGFGDNANTQQFFYTETTGEKELQFQGSGLKGPTGSDISVAVSGSSVEVLVQVGYHAVKVI